MKTQFRESFVKDLRKIRDRELLDRLKAVIEAIEQTENAVEILDFERLKGWHKYYRIRVGDYRVGIIMEGETITFVRFLHRKDIYRYFP